MEFFFPILFVFWGTIILGSIIHLLTELPEWIFTTFIVSTVLAVAMYWDYWH